MSEVTQLFQTLVFAVSPLGNPIFFTTITPFDLNGVDNLEYRLNGALQT